jgi:hypothetical protein
MKLPANELDVAQAKLAHQRAVELITALIARRRHTYGLDTGLRARSSPAASARFEITTAIDASSCPARAASIQCLQIAASARNQHAQDDG